jgi:myo-inositol catabolism protein IolC
MTQEEAIQRIEAACKAVALEMMKITPAARHLGDEETTAEVVKAAYQLTVELEIIKKKLIRLKGRDDSALL